MEITGINLACGCTGDACELDADGMFKIVKKKRSAIIDKKPLDT